MLSVGAAGRGDVDERADGVVASVQSYLATGIAWAEKSSGDQAGRGFLFVDCVSSDRQQHESGAVAASQGPGHFVAVDEDVVGEGDGAGIEDEQLQLWLAGLSERRVGGGTVAGGGVADPEDEVVLGLHDEIRVAEVDAVDREGGIGPRRCVERDLVRIE